MHVHPPRCFSLSIFFFISFSRCVLCRLCHFCNHFCCCFSCALPIFVCNIILSFLLSYKMRFYHRHIFLLLNCQLCMSPTQQALLRNSDIVAIVATECDRYKLQVPLSHMIAYSFSQIYQHTVCTCRDTLAIVCGNQFQSLLYGY